jgi:hypothetical protein
MSAFGNPVGDGEGPEIAMFVFFCNEKPDASFLGRMPAVFAVETWFGHIAHPSPPNNPKFQAKSWKDVWSSLLLRHRAGQTPNPPNFADSATI